jgi:hypothetical protein
MYATYQREYENFTHLPGESIDVLFSRFTVVVNNMRANVDMLPYDDHDSAVKLLHSLDRTAWGEKIEAIVESEKYDTLTVNKLFLKLKSTEVDRGMTAKIDGPVSVLDWQTYQGGTRGGRLSGEDRDRETENSKVRTRIQDTRFIQVRATKVANPTSYLGDQVWHPTSYFHPSLLYIV